MGGSYGKLCYVWRATVYNVSLKNTGLTIDDIIADLGIFPLNIHQHLFTYRRAQLLKDPVVLIIRTGCDLRDSKEMLSKCDLDVASLSHFFHCIQSLIVMSFDRNPT